MINKRVLIGLTYIDHTDKCLEQKQMHGKIISVDKTNGIEIALEGSRDGEIYMLPPDLRSFHEAAPGEVNPDFTTTWTITQKDPNSHL